MYQCINYQLTIIRLTINSDSVSFLLGCFLWSPSGDNDCYDYFGREAFGYSDSEQISIKGLFFLFENETTLVTLLYSRSIGETFGCS